MTGVSAIERELMRRIKRNPKYSLRAFAKTIGVSHTALSLVLSGKRHPSTRLLNKFADKMAMPPDERDVLLKNNGFSSKNIDTNLIDLDYFELISDWRHYAVLSLLELPTAKYESKWIAKRLNISSIEARDIMDRLRRLSLVGEKDGRMIQASMPIRMENKISTAATRRFHQQLLKKAEESLENDPIEIRDFSSMTFALDQSLVPYATQKIREFRRRLVADLEKKGNSNKVFQLNVQLYPVSH